MAVILRLLNLDLGFKYSERFALFFEFFSILIGPDLPP